MKRTLTLLAALFMVAAVTATASAEMVNVGTIAIDRSDLEDIRNRVSVVQSPNHVKSAVHHKPVELNIGVATMGAADHAALEDYVSGRKELQLRSGKARTDNLADIGVVEISKSDLYDIEELTSWMQKKGPGLLAVEMPVALFK